MGDSLSILVVTHNTRALTAACLASVERHLPGAEVVLVDNASTDGTAAAVRALFPDVTVVSSDRNLGFAAANNLAFGRATRDTIVLLNSDAEVTDDSLLDCAALLGSDEALGAVHPLLVGTDGLPQDCEHPEPTLTQQLRRAFRLAETTDRTDPTWLAGTCLVLKRTAVDAAGGLFDPQFRFYWEDCDLGARLREAGFRSAVCPESTVLHHGGASGGGPDAARRPDLAAWYLYGKHAWFAAHRGRVASAALWWLDAADVVRMTVRSLVRADRRHERSQARTFAGVLANRLLGRTPPPLSGRTPGRSDLGGVTAVVIGRNEGDRLVACLESLASEVDRVVYVDSGSTDGSREAAAALSADVVELSPDEPFTAARARNAGLDRVRTPYALLVDGDCRVEPGFVAAAVAAAASSSEIVAVCGVRREVNPRGTVYNRLCDAEWNRSPGDDVASCGGDALVRVDAVHAAGGYAATMIAGEEPELCHRIRQQGGRVVRLGLTMTRHDANMTGFGQWWTRAVRAGHAYAEMSSRHRWGRLRQNLSAALFGGILPALLCVAVGVGEWPPAAALLLPYLVIALRMTRSAVRRGDSLVWASTQAAFGVAAKLAHFIGWLTFHGRRLLRRRAELIEYKAAAPRGLAYLTSEYPRPSHTFIRREIAGLESLGWHVHRFSVRGLGEATLRDPADVAEDGRTFKLLDHLGAIVAATVRTAAGRPVRFVRALGLAVTLWRGSHRTLVQHLAYLAEACLLRERTAYAGIAHTHVHFGKNAADVALLCESLGGPSFSMAVHGPGEFDAPAPFALGRKVAASRFSAAISDFGSGQLRRWTPVEAWPKVKVVRCTVGDDFLDRLSPVTCEAPRFVCVGRLTPQKGQLLLLEAVAKLKAAGTRVEVTFVGDGELRGEIADRAAEWGVDDRVEVTGFVDEAEVRRRLRGSRALVLPSFAEGLPVAVMEALAVGRPVITTAIAGIPELVVDNACGRLVTSGSVDALCEALADLAARPLDRLTAMGREGHRRVRSMHRQRDEAAKLSGLLSRETAARPLAPTTGGGEPFPTARPEHALTAVVTPC